MAASPLPSLLADMLLLAGCSFVNDPECGLAGFGPVAHDYNRCRNVARSGAGNHYIASSILSHLDSDTTEVFVLWSGLTRIDVPLPKACASFLDSYSHVSVEKHDLWLHSGGWAGSWAVHKHYPNWLREYLENLYHPQDWHMINRHSLMAIAGCLNTLEAAGIAYRWGFIHDIHADYSHNSSLGPPVDRNEPLLDLLPQHNKIASTPLEFCKNRNLLNEDGFHPNKQGWQEWFESLDNWRH